MSLLANAYYTTLHRTSTLIAQLIGIGFLSVIYHYLKRLQEEKCECALTPEYITLRRMIIVVLSLVVFLTTVTIILQFVYLSRPSNIILISLYIIAVVTTIIQIVFSIISLRYILHLYKISCKCSDNGMRIVYLIYTIFRLIIVTFSILVIIFIVLILMYVYIATSKTKSAAIRDHTKPNSKPNSRR